MPCRSWKKNLFNRWWQYQRKIPTKKPSGVLLMSRQWTPKQTLDTLNVIMKLHALCSITQHLLITQMKKGKWKGGLGFSFLNISINLTYFNIFPASIHMLSSQDGWSCHSIPQTDELKPKQCIFLFRLMNRRSVNQTEIKSILAYPA